MTFNKYFCRRGKGLSSQILLNILAMATLIGPAYATDTIFDDPSIDEVDRLAQGLSAPNQPQSINVDVAIEQLRTANQASRREIITDLKQQGVINLAALTKALSESDPLVKSGAAEVLGSLGEAAEPAIQPLVEMLDDQRYGRVPLANSYSLVLPPPLVNPLPSLSSLPTSSPPTRKIPTPLKNPDYRLQISAAVALGQIGPISRQAATPKLTELRSSTDPWIALNAAWALMNIGAEVEVLPTFMRLLGHPNAEVRAEVASLLGSRSGLVPKILGAEATPETPAAIIAAFDTVEPYDRFHLRNALTTIGSRAIAPLIETLSHPNPILRFEAIKTLGDFEQNATDAIPQLLTLLKDSAQLTRRLKQPSTTLPRISLSRPPLPNFGHQTRYYPRPGNPEKVIKVEAALALKQIIGYYPHPASKAALSQALSDSMPRMRLAAAWTLLSTEQERLSAEDERRIMDITAAIATSNQQPWQRSSPQDDALHLLKSVGKPATPYLLPYYDQQLDQADQGARIQAIIATGKLGRLALPLVPRLRDQFLDSNTVYNGYAATILGQIALDLKAGYLPPPERLKAIQELELVLKVMDSPQHRFNQEPVKFVRQSLEVLKARSRP